MVLEQEPVGGSHRFIRQILIIVGNQNDLVPLVGDLKAASGVHIIRSQLRGVQHGLPPDGSGAR